MTKKIPDKYKNKLKPRLTKYIPIKPTPKQSAFMLLENKKELLFGGAAGGGKSEALLAAALQYVDVPSYAALILRKNFAQLTKSGALIPRSKEWLMDTDAEWNERKKRWKFPSGARLDFGHIQHEDDKHDYQSAEYQYVAFDELTQFKESQYEYLHSRTRRGSESNIPIRIRAATNPIGRGLDWVRSRFINQDHPDRGFIPATVEDNPHIDTEEYKESLKSLDPITKEKLLNGNWGDLDKGKVFSREPVAVVDEPLAEIRHKVRFWDFAATAPSSRNPDPDYCAGVLFAKDVEGRYYVMDVKRTRENSDGVEELIQQTAWDDGREVPMVLEIEGGSQAKIAVDYYVSDVLEGFIADTQNVSTGKMDRAKPLASQWRQGNVYLIRGGWNKDYLDELISIPDGRHDDQMDATSGAFNWLMEEKSDWVFG